MIIPTLAHQIIKSRFLILQTKQLMLGSCERLLDERRLDETGSDALRRRVVQLRQDATRARHAYRAAMLQWGSADNPEYWVVAYGRLVDVGQALASKLRQAASQLPVHEGYEVAADADALEEIVADWTARMRRSMAQAVVMEELPAETR